MAVSSPDEETGLNRLRNASLLYSILFVGILLGAVVGGYWERVLAGFLSALALYYGDITLLEPQLLRLYDDVLPQLDNALGDTLPRRVR